MAIFCATATLLRIRLRSVRDRCCDDADKQAIVTRQQFQASIIALIDNLSTPLAQYLHSAHSPLRSLPSDSEPWHGSWFPSGAGCLSRGWEVRTDVLNALSVDLEDWYQCRAMQDVVPRHQWERCPSRLEANTFRLLAILAEAGARATFFVLGWNAERYPRLVLQIERSGHELAIHGYQHVAIGEQTAVQFAWEVARCQEIMEQVAGKRARGFRAASAAPAPAIPRVLATLLENGIEYDSSPSSVGTDAPRYAHQVALDGKGTILEFPISKPFFAGADGRATTTICLPLTPLHLVRRSIRGLNQSGQPALVCLYPWELETDLPRQVLPRSLLPLENALRRESRLAALLRDFHFAPVAEVLEANRHILPCFSLDVFDKPG